MGSEELPLRDTAILKGSFLSHQTTGEEVSVSGAAISLPIAPPEDKESNQALFQLKERLRQIDNQKNQVEPEVSELHTPSI